MGRNQKQNLAVCHVYWCIDDIHYFCCRVVFDWSVGRNEISTSISCDVKSSMLVVLAVLNPVACEDIFEL